jgi:hypothetical protein
MNHLCDVGQVQYMAGPKSLLLGLARGAAR